MKRVVVTIVVVGALITYILIHGPAGPAAETVLAPQVPSAPPPTPTPIPSATTALSSATPSPSPTPVSPYKDGTYIGKPADAQWGLVQVEAIIQGGRITAIQWLQHPSDRSQSVEINANADPKLTSEALQAQSAHVNIVTGATDSSDAFIQSLGDALTQSEA